MSTDRPDPQPPLPGIDTTRANIRRANEIAKRESKKRRARRRHLPVLQPELVADNTFMPIRGVPASRAECPKDGLCQYMCRWNLLIEDAEHRAGRPGLSSVPRDERGLTLPASGHAGDERPGTTLRPAWLRVRGLEVERECRVFVWRANDEEGIELLETRDGAMDYWLARLHPGEPVLAFDDDTGEMVARVELTSDGRLKFDRAFDATFVVLTRVRGVSSCALDEIERRGKMTNEQVGDCIGRHRTLVAREVKRALEKAMGAAEHVGMTEDDLLKGLRELGAGQ